LSPDGAIAVGERARLVELASLSDVHRVWADLQAHPPEGAIEIVAGARSVLIVLSDGAGRGPAPAVGRETSREVVIPVEYSGADLAEVARLTGLPVPEVVDRHCGVVYTVAFLGFSPGFAYLVGGDPVLNVPRLDVPRPSVPAGSVAVAAEMTAVYPQSTPGGWRLLGRTDTPMFDPWAVPGQPALLAPGDRVRFDPVASVGPAPVVRAPRLGSPEGPRVQILSVGGRLTVQDRGRLGWAHAGVPRGGAADRASAALANALAGNEAGEALFESTLGGARLRLMAPRPVAITGAPGPVTVDGMPARMNTALAVPAGAEIQLGPVQRGLHTYVAVGGGLDVEPILGSRSTDTLSGLGPGSLRPGDLVALCVSPGGTGRPPTASDVGQLPAPGDLVTVRALLGPREEHLGAAGIAALENTEFRVSSTSDRTGVRLDGPALPSPSSGVIPSEGMVPGAVQLPPGGHPVVLLRNHPPTGGYPVVAVVDDGDVDVLAQSPAGVRVRFVLR
jgi:KipI family sensor histidine kinase inhibitor